MRGQLDIEIKLFHQLNEIYFLWRDDIPNVCVDGNVLVIYFKGSELYFPVFPVECELLIELEIDTGCSLLEVELLTGNHTLICLLFFKDNLGADVELLFVTVYLERLPACRNLEYFLGVFNSPGLCSQASVIDQIQELEVVQVSYGPDDCALELRSQSLLQHVPQVPSDLIDLLRSLLEDKEFKLRIQVLSCLELDRLPSEGNQIVSLLNGELVIYQWRCQLHVQL